MPGDFDSIAARQKISNDASIAKCRFRLLNVRFVYHESQLSLECHLLVTGWACLSKQRSELLRSRGAVAPLPNRRALRAYWTNARRSPGSLFAHRSATNGSFDTPGCASAIWCGGILCGTRFLTGISRRRSYGEGEICVWNTDSCRCCENGCCDGCRNFNLLLTLMNTPATSQPPSSTSSGRSLLPAATGLRPFRRGRWGGLRGIRRRWRGGFAR